MATLGQLSVNVKTNHAAHARDRSQKLLATLTQNVMVLFKGLESAFASYAKDLQPGQNLVNELTQIPGQPHAQGEIVSEKLPIDSPGNHDIQEHGKQGTAYRDPRSSALQPWQPSFDQGLFQKLIDKVISLSHLEQGSKMPANPHTESADRPQKQSQNPSTFASIPAAFSSPPLMESLTQIISQTANPAIASESTRSKSQPYPDPIPLLSSLLQQSHASLQTLQAIRIALSDLGHQLMGALSMGRSL